MDARTETARFSKGKFQKQVATVLTCSVSQGIFVDPVLLNPCGHSFEKEKIKEWLHKNKTCPECRSVIIGEPIPNHALRNTVDILINQQPEILFSPEHIVQYINENKIEEIIKIFKAHPSEINHPIDDGYTVLHLAVKAAQKKLIQALINNFPTIVNQLTVRPGRAFHQATALLLSTCSSITTLLLKHGADPSISTGAGTTAFLMALWRQNWKQAEILLNSYQDLNINQIASIESKNKFTCALTLAVEQDCPQDLFLKILSIPGICLNANNHKHKPALYKAAEMGNGEKVAALLAQPGIDVESKYKPGSKTAMEAAEEFPDVVALFTTYQVRIALLKWKVAHSELSDACDLFKEIYFDNFDNNGEAIYQLHKLTDEFAESAPEFCKRLLPRILEIALDRSDTTLIKHLLKANPKDINQPIPGFDGFNALSQAVFKNNLTVVKAILENFKNATVHSSLFEIQTRCSGLISCLLLMWYLIRNPAKQAKINFENLYQINSEDLDFVCDLMRRLKYDDAMIKRIKLVIHLIKTNPDPVNSENDFFQNEKMKSLDLTILNRLFGIAFSSTSHNPFTKKFAWDKYVRYEALACLKKADAAGQHDINSLSLLRKQTIFAKHRDPIHLGRTGAQCEIDNMLKRFTPR